MTDVVFEKATCWYAGAPKPAVAELDLAVADGELLALCGAPESGKSTVLRMLAGLVPVTSGRILLDGEDLSAAVGPVVLVFQNYALYPNLTVSANIALPLTQQRVGKREVTARVDDAARHLGLTGMLRRRGSQLTAGERIRVAVARALVRRPAVLLMDEPLANLEPGIRAEGAQLLRSAQRDHQITTIFATGDAEEALDIGDRVALLEGGALQEVVDPSAVVDSSPGQRRAHIDHTD